MMMQSTVIEYDEEYDNPLNYDEDVEDYDERILRFINHRLKVNGTTPKLPTNEYEFVNDSGYEFEQIPDFAKCIFNDPYLGNNSKDEFKSEILDRYFSDEEFKSLVDKGCIITFMNGKLQKLFKTVEDTYQIGNSQDDVKLYTVSNHLNSIFPCFLSKI